MKSELFSESYCIFVDQKNSEHYKKELENNNLLEKGVRVLNAKFDMDISCIVIPNHCDYNKIRETLWENRKEGGFWHQWGIGYKEKEWELA
jgi:hypothetical protein